MSKYTEYREIVSKMEQFYEANVENKESENVRIFFNPVSNSLNIGIYDHSKRYFEISGDTGLALFKALKQIYE
jgi:predicted secreted protein